MIGIKSNHLLILIRNLYKERLTVLIGQVNLLTHCQFLRSRKLCDLDFNNRIRTGMP